MPATLTAPHFVPAAVDSPTVLVADLSSVERAVALYSSDMPTGFARRTREDDAQLCDWIIQGAVRLGLDELHLSAAYVQSYRVLKMAKLATSDQERAHRRRFANSARLTTAHEAAVITTCFVISPTREAIKRSTRPAVEGNCRCHASGWIRQRQDLDDASSSYAINCPGHNPNGTGSPISRKPVIV